MIASAMVTHALNWNLGWGLVLAGFLSGAAIGMKFHREDYLGGYTSFPRRMLRLGHIALIALGLLNVVFSITPFVDPLRSTAAVCFAAGAVLMPLLCFLTAWRSGFRRLFFVPVVTLVTAVTLMLVG